MLKPVSLRSTALLSLLAATACNYDLNEKPAGSPAAGSASRAVPAPALREVRWELRELDGQPAPTTEAGQFLVLREGRDRAEGQAGCNRFSGPYTTEASGQLRLGPLVTTRKACPDLVAEGAFLKALNQARQYRIRGTWLHLYAADTAGVPLARLKAVTAP